MGARPRSLPTLSSQSVIEDLGRANETPGGDHFMLEAVNARLALGLL